ncbi:MAG: LacI family DNA-binding transcriptional regulator [Verrucomicrobiota bacterium]
MRPTLKQIAERTNLSIPTVSEILNNKKRLYNSETRTRVLEVARQMGYRPNESARSIQSGRFGAIALLQSSDEKRNSLPGSLLYSIEETLSEHHLLLTLASVKDEQLADETFVPQILRILAVDGLVINYIAGFPQRLVSLMHDYRIPFMWLNVKLGDDCVYPDDINAARTATEHLLSLGHTKIALVDYTFGHNYTNAIHYSRYDRAQGYGEAMARAGLPTWDIRDEKNIPLEERRAFSVRWLKDPVRPTAALTYNWETALPLFAAALSIGLRIPEDFSVITFHDRVANDLGSPIDTMVLPQHEMGRLAVTRILEKIEDPLKSYPPQAIPLDFQKGWTTGPAPKTIRPVP